MITKLIINQAILKKIKNINIPLVVPIAFFVLEVVFFIYYRNTWYDEATYQYNGWAIYQFGWLPYQDIWLKLPPLAYYIFGLPQYLFGPSLYVGRITAAVFLFLGTWLMYKIAKKLSGNQGAFWSLVFLALTPFLVSNYISGTVYSLVFFFVMAAFWFLLSPKKGQQIIFSLLFALLAVLVRQNLAPLFFIIFVYLLITIKDGKSRCYIFLTPFFTLVLILFPFVLIDYKIFINDLLSLVKGFPDNMPLAYDPATIDFKIDLVRMVKGVNNFFREYFGIALIFFSITAGWLFRDIRKYFSSFLNTKEIHFVFLLILSFITLFGFHFLFPGVIRNFMHSLYFIPLAILVISIFIGKFLKTVNSLFLKKLAILTLAVLIILSLVTVNIQSIFEDFPNSFAIAKTDLGKIRNAAQVIKPYFNKNDLVFTLDESHLFLEAHLKMPPAFSSRFHLYVSDALLLQDKSRYWNIESLRDLLAVVDGVILQRGRWESYFSGLEEADEIISLIKNSLSQRCRLVELIPNAVPEKYIFDDQGKVEVYLCNNE